MSEKPSEKDALEALKAITPKAILHQNLEADRAKADSRRWKSLYDAAKQEVAEAQEREAAWLQTTKHVAPIRIKPTKRKEGHEAAAVFVASDWHVEENVDPATISGLNEYNPDIAQQRVRATFENALTLINKERSLARIDHMVLAPLGDMITGFIHEELQETNWLHPVEALLLAKSLLAGGIEFLLEHGRFKTLSVICSYGNHGRTTKRKRVSNGAKTSYEWMMFRDLADQYSQDGRVAFQVSEGGIQYSEIMGTRIRWLHGDQIRYQGGVGGLTIPLYKAIAKWDTSHSTDYTVLGHWHQLGYYRRACVNGSVIGYNAYAEEIKAEYEPPQQALFLVGANHGPTCFNRVFTE